jgi:hypothetical protein
MEIVLSYVLKAVGICAGSIIIALGKKAYSAIGLKMDIDQEKIFTDKVQKELYFVEEKIADLIKSNVGEKTIEATKIDMKNKVVDIVVDLKNVTRLEAKKEIDKIIAPLSNIGAFKF